jgi:spore coat protein U-like protein
MNKKYLIVSYVYITAFLLACSAVAHAVCTVSTTPVTFGSYDVFSSSPLDAEGSITVLCNENPQPNVVVSIETSPNSGSFDPRMMKLIAGSDMLEYNFFTDTGRTQIWGDGSGSTFIQSNRVNKNRPWTQPVYGRIPPLQDASAGSYSETVTVTINW